MQRSATKNFVARKFDGSTLNFKKCNNRVMTIVFTKLGGKRYVGTDWLRYPVSGIPMQPRKKKK